MYKYKLNIHSMHIFKLIMPIMCKKSEIKKSGIFGIMSGVGGAFPMTPAQAAAVAADANASTYGI